MKPTISAPKNLVVVLPIFAILLTLSSQSFAMTSPKNCAAMLTGSKSWSSVLKAALLSIPVALGLALETSAQQPSAELQKQVGAWYATATVDDPKTFEDETRITHVELSDLATIYEDNLHLWAGTTRSESELAAAISGLNHDGKRIDLDKVFNEYYLVDNIRPIGISHGTLDRLAKREAESRAPFTRPSPDGITRFVFKNARHTPASAFRPEKEIYTFDYEVQRFLGSKPVLVQDYKVEVTYFHKADHLTNKHPALIMYDVYVYSQEKRTYVSRRLPPEAVLLLAKALETAATRPARISFEESSKYSIGNFSPLKIEASAERATLTTPEGNLPLLRNYEVVFGENENAELALWEKLKEYEASKTRSPYLHSYEHATIYYPFYLRIAAVQGKYLAEKKLTKPEHEKRTEMFLNTMRWLVNFGWRLGKTQEQIKADLAMAEELEKHENLAEFQKLLKPARDAIEGILDSGVQTVDLEKIKAAREKAERIIVQAMEPGFMPWIQIPACDALCMSGFQKALKNESAFGLASVPGLYKFATENGIPKTDPEAVTKTTRVQNDLADKILLTAAQSGVAGQAEALFAKLKEFEAAGIVNRNHLMRSPHYGTVAEGLKNAPNNATATAAFQWLTEPLLAEAQKAVAEAINGKSPEAIEENLKKAQAIVAKHPYLADSVKIPTKEEACWTSFAKLFANFAEFKKMTIGELFHLGIVSGTVHGDPAPTNEEKLRQASQFFAALIAEKISDPAQNSQGLPGEMKVLEEAGLTVRKILSQAEDFKTKMENLKNLGSKDPNIQELFTYLSAPTESEIQSILAQATTHTILEEALKLLDQAKLKLGQYPLAGSAALESEIKAAHWTVYQNMRKDRVEFAKLSLMALYRLATATRDANIMQVGHDLSDKILLDLVNWTKSGSEAAAPDTLVTYLKDPNAFELIPLSIRHTTMLESEAYRPTLIGVRQFSALKPELAKAQLKALEDLIVPIRKASEALIAQAHCSDSPEKVFDSLTKAQELAKKFPIVIEIPKGEAVCRIKYEEGMKNPEFNIEQVPTLFGFAKSSDLQTTTASALIPQQLADRALESLNLKLEKAIQERGLVELGVLSAYLEKFRDFETQGVFSRTELRASPHYKPNVAHFKYLILKLDAVRDGSEAALLDIKFDPAIVTNELVQAYVTLHQWLTSFE